MTRSATPRSTRRPATGKAAPQRIPPPSLRLLALELRAPVEALGTLALWPALMLGPRGDGHSVLVLPGLAATDTSTAVLRRFLRLRGYDAQPWGLGRNRGARGVMEACVERVRGMQKLSGRRVSLVGWSLGGVFAREVAKLSPEAVRCVITLGSPFTGHPRATNAWRAYEWLSGQKADADPSMLARMREAPPVPTTSIYSRTDGIVSWACSVQSPAGQTENIEVPASHIGMGANPFVLHVVANRLAQPEARWQPFAPADRSRGASR